MPAKQRDSSVLVPLFIWDKTGIGCTIIQSASPSATRKLTKPSSRPRTAGLSCARLGAGEVECAVADG